MGVLEIKKVKNLIKGVNGEYILIEIEVLVIFREVIVLTKLIILSLNKGVWCRKVRILVVFKIVVTLL